MAASRSLILMALAILSVSVMASAHEFERREHPRIATIYVQGTIFCSVGKNTTVIKGATAKVECKTLSVPVKPFKAVSPPSDAHGFYLIKFPAIVNGTRLGHCNATLNSSPLPKCNVTTNVNGGIKGAPLIKFRQLRGGNRLYTVHPFFYTSNTTTTK